MKVVEERQAHVHTHFAIGSLLVGVNEQLELLALSLKWETWTSSVHAHVLWFFLKHWAAVECDSYSVRPCQGQSQK